VWQPTLAVASLVLGLALDRFRTPFPHYGSLSVGPALILANLSSAHGEARVAALGLLVLFLWRGRFEADVLPAAMALAIGLAFPATLPVLGFVYFSFSLLHPLGRSSAFPRLPGAFVFRSLPLQVGAAAVICSGTWLEGVAGLALQVAILAALLGLARGQRGLSLETAYQQESLRLQSEQVKEWLRLLDALGYAMHDQARPEQLLSELGQAMARLAQADTHVLAEKVAGSWTIVEHEGLGREISAKAFAGIMDQGRSGKVSLKAGWDGERHAVIIPWESEAALYLGRRKSPVDSLPLLERLGRMGAAALRSAREKAQKDALKQRGQHLQSWVEDLTSLLREIHFVGATLERDDLLRRLKETLGRSVRPDVAYLYSPEGVERAWGGSAAEAPPAPARPEGQAQLVAAPNGFATAMACSLGPSGCLLLLYREPPAASSNILPYLGVLGDVVGTFLSNSQLYDQLRSTHQALEASQGELVQAKKLAAVGQLAAGVAHEINNPLLAITVHLDLIKPALSDPEDLECAETIEQAVERCRVIVSQLLSFSRKPSSPPVVLKMAALCREAIAMSGVRVSPAGDLGDCRVRGNAHEIVSILVNLLTNARDAGAREEGVRLVVESDPTSVRLSVADTGPGVPPEIADRIFEPFFTTKEVGSGTGLGLYMAYTYATNAGGELKLAGSSPEGAVFTLILPRV
jgi:signal transduction histidine kinase